MTFVGCDLHTRTQQVAVLDTRTGEVSEQQLVHDGSTVEEFYTALRRPVSIHVNNLPLKTVLKDLRAFQGINILADRKALKAEGIEPFWCINHGPTISMYFKDPDANRVELQVEHVVEAERPVGEAHRREHRVVLPEEAVRREVEEPAARRVVEEGRHGELVAKQGAYARLHAVAEGAGF